MSVQIAVVDGSDQLYIATVDPAGFYRTVEFVGPITSRPGSQTTLRTRATAAARRAGYRLTGRWRTVDGHEVRLVAPEGEA